jgi:hypothetical protein
MKMPANESIRHVRLFKNGRSGRLTLQPMPLTKLVDLLSIWTPLGDKDQLPAIEDRHAEPLEI